MDAQADAPAISASSRPSWLMRRALALPILLYRIGLAARVGKRFLVLTTTGRRTGRPRRCALNYTRDGELVYVASGFGRTDWYRNLVTDPHVEVQIGKERWHGHARLVSLPAERRRVLGLLRDRALEQGPPRALRPIVRRLGVDYEGRVGRLRYPAAKILLVAIRIGREALAAA